MLSKSNTTWEKNWFKKSAKRRTFGMCPSALFHLHWLPSCAQNMNLQILFNVGYRDIVSVKGSLTE